MDKQGAGLFNAIEFAKNRRELNHKDNKWEDHSNKDADKGSTRAINTDRDSQ
jgi:hypothetical protein